MIHRLYEKLLEMRISKANLPGCIAIVLSSGDLFDEGLDKLRDIIEWSRSMGLASLVLYINDNEPTLCGALPLKSLCTQQMQICLQVPAGG